MNLQSLAIKYGSDKIKDCHSFHGKNYMHHYQDLFDPIKDEVKSILEIGVYLGNSLRVWSDYFPNAKILGIDIDPECLNHAPSSADIFIGCQSEDTTLQKIISKYKEIDIIIDDGSHLIPDIKASFKKLFPYLNS